MVAMLVTPAATAYLLTFRLPVMMALAAVLAAISGVVGLYFSYYLSIASERQSCYVNCHLLYGVPFAPRRGLVWSKGGV